MLLLFCKCYGNYFFSCHNCICRAFLLTSCMLCMLMMAFDFCVLMSVSFDMSIILYTLSVMGKLLCSLKNKFCYYNHHHIRLELLYTLMIFFFFFFSGIPSTGSCSSSLKFIVGVGYNCRAFGSDGYVTYNSG